MFASRLTSLAGDRASDVKARSSLATILADMDANASNLVILDLSMPGQDLNETVPRLREHAPHDLKIVAFAPHVHESKLAAARDANCDVVLSKGQFNNQIGDLLRAHLG